MKRNFILLFLLFGTINCFAQQDRLVERMKKFHLAMIESPAGVSSYIHDALNYGHSNGWIENAKEFKEHLGGYIIYHSIKEDSISTSSTGSEVAIRFVAEIDVTLRGVRTTFRLKVLEVWVKKKKQWLLFARQAVKA